MKSRLTTLIVMTLLLGSCSTIRIKATGEASSGKEKLGKFVYRKSIKVGAGNIVFCAITGIFYGGWCWTYLGMPNSGHRSKLRKALIEDLKAKTGLSSIDLDKISMRRLSWSNEASSLELDGAVSSPVPKSPKRKKKKSSSSDSEEFLR